MLTSIIQSLSTAFGDILEALLNAFPHHQAIHHDLDGVLFLFVQGRRFVQRVHFAVDAHAHKAVLERLLQQLHMFALAGADDGRQQLNAAALGHGQHGRNDLIQALLADLPAAVGAVGDTDAGVHQAQIIMDLGHRAYGGARIAGRGLLVNADGRAQTLDQIGVGLVHLPQKLARVGGHAFHIAALTLGVDGIKGQAALARAAQAGEHDQLVPWQGNVHIFQVVFPCALYNDGIVHVSPPQCDLQRKL